MASSLNLRPSERRLLVVVGLALFVVVNIWMVWPRFSELEKVRKNRTRALKKLSDYKTQIGKEPALKRKVAELEAGSRGVPAMDQAIELLRAIQKEAAHSGVTITGNSRQNATTNEFFIEQSQTINLVAGEKELVAFLYNLGSDEGSDGTTNRIPVRVRDLSLRPDPPRQRLTANITLVASYQNTTPARPARTPVRTPAK